MRNDTLTKKANEFAHAIYKLSRTVPSHERFGFISQLRRAVLSIPLNIVEGYARQSDKEYRRFLLIAYGSYKETVYLITFGCEENYCTKQDADAVLSLGDEVGKLLWTHIKNLA